jgi:hypothetical protein
MGVHGTTGGTILPVGSGSSATLRATEHADAAAFVGFEPPTGTLSIGDAADGPAFLGWVPDSILTVQEAGDGPALAGSVDAPGSIAPAEASDRAVAHGFLIAGHDDAAEASDLAAFAASFTAPGQLGPTERGDHGTLRGLVHNTTTLGTPDGGDAAAFGALAVAPGHLAARDGGDRPSWSASAALAGTLDQVEGTDTAAWVLHAEGIPPTFRVREAGDVGTLIADHPTLHYLVYVNDGLGGPIDYSAPIAHTCSTSWSPPPLPPGTWSYGIRASNPFGIEENLDCALSIVIGPDGQDWTCLPPPPVGLRAIPGPGASLLACWTAGTLPAGDPRAPTGFTVHIAPLGEPLDYLNPVATVDAAAALQGISTAAITGLVDRTTYSLGVRAVNAVGTELNTNTVTATARGSGPGPVIGLTANLTA